MTERKIDYHKVIDWPKGMDESDGGLQKARWAMGIRPRHTAPVKTEFYRGAAITSVELLSGPANPYRDMAVAALQTWGTPGLRKVDTWESLEPENRMRLVYAILTRRALPLAREVPDFFFEIRNISRIAYDQIVRARIGVSVSSLGTRNNNVADINVMVPPRIYDDPKQATVFTRGVDAAKEAYGELVQLGASWEDARYAIPQGILHGFSFDINYEALAALLGKRMMFCMEFSTVTTAWKMWVELRKKYAVLAAPIRPNCDYAKRCTMRAENDMGEAFSNDPHSGCGRWPDENPVGYFPGPSTEPEWINDWTSGAVFAGDVPTDWQAAFEKDKGYFL